MSSADKVKNIIVDKLGVEESRIVPEASFLDDLGADSLDKTSNNKQRSTWSITTIYSKNDS